jgi:hypothetical protein
MKNATTRALHAYWDRLRAGRAAPERGDVDPGAIRTLLGDVFLLEMDGQARTSVRLAGTRICTLLGQEWKGRPFDGAFPAGDRREIQILIDGVCAAAVPVVAGVVGETPDGRQLDLEMLVLPLRHRGKTHARLLGSLSAENWPYWAGQTPLSRLRLVSVRHLNDGPAEAAAQAPAVPRSTLGRLRLLPGGRA